MAPPGSCVCDAWPNTAGIIYVSDVRLNSAGMSVSDARPNSAGMSVSDARLNSAGMSVSDDRLNMLRSNAPVITAKTGEHDFTGSE